MRRKCLISVRLRGSLPPTAIPLSEVELLCLAQYAARAGTTPGALLRAQVHAAANTADYRGLVLAAAECGLSLPEWARIVALASIGGSPLGRQLARASA